MLSCSLRDVRCHVLKMGAVSRGDGASVRIIYTTPHWLRWGAVYWLLSSVLFISAACLLMTRSIV